MISFICPSIRPQYWQSLRDQIAFKELEFEIIFLGPVKNFYNIPENCRHIRTFVKPAQCYQAGVVNSKYKYMAFLTDDITFNKTNYLEMIYKNINLVENSRTILSFKFSSYGVNLWGKMKEYNSMSLPVCAVMKKSDFFKIGGIDRRFISVMHDVDLYLRFLESGFKNIFLNVIATEKIRTLGFPSLYNKFYNKDGALFKQLWFKDKVFSLERRDSVKKYSNKNLTNITVKPYGKWKNTNYIINIFRYNKIYFLLIKFLTLDFNFIYNFYQKNKNKYFFKKLKKLLKD